jgi:TRAP-type mannitol/chloroaromatic compound transport system permease small subunit
MWLSVTEENIIYKDFTEKGHFLKEILGSVLFLLWVANSKR